MKLHSLLLLMSLTLVSTRLPAAEPILLRAGPLTMVFEPENAFLRYIKFGSQEVLRGITAPVRDQAWGTVRPQVTNLQLDRQTNQFSLQFDVQCREKDIDFFWQGKIKGGPEGDLEYTFDGIARSTFMRNRIGFCLLHGEAAAGQPWVIENIAGEKTPGHFPSFISPHQPAKEIRAISHQFAPDSWAHVRLEGDTFEMEDQRNWTDASFKTYCTPLGLRYPVRVAAGTKVVQKITLKLETKNSTNKGLAASDDARPILTLRSEHEALPRLGMRLADESDLPLELFKDLHLDHVRVDLAPTNSSFASTLRRAVKQAKALGVRLHVGLHLSTTPEQELQALAAELKALRPSVAMWLIIGAEEPVYRSARAVLQKYQGKALVGAGEDTNFTELNRRRPDVKTVQVVSYGLNPQVHAFDHLSIVETLAIQGDTVRSARQFLGDLPLVVSPITLRPLAVADADVRQASPFAASWTVGSIKYLAEAGVHSVTYFETVGPKGVVPSPATKASSRTATSGGGLLPIYQVLREVGDFAGGRVQRFDSSDPLSIVGLALTKGSRHRWLIANLTDRPQTVVVRGLGERVKVDYLRSGGGAGSNEGRETTLELPIVLEPYGIARLDRTKGR